GSASCPLKKASSTSAPITQASVPSSWSSSVRKRPWRICQPVACRYLEVLPRMSTCLSSLPPWVTEASVPTRGAIASGRVLLASIARQSRLFTLGRFLYFHQSLPSTPHFHLCTNSVLGPSVL